MFCLFFSKTPVNSYRDVMNCDTELYKQFFEGMVREGILLAPSQFEAWFPSAAHTQDILDRTVEAVKHVFAEIRK